MVPSASIIAWTGTSTLFSRKSFVCGTIDGAGLITIPAGGNARLEQQAIEGNVRMNIQSGGHLQWQGLMRGSDDDDRGGCDR